MGKITVNKNVFWDAGGKKMSGKVKQIFNDHALVKAEGCDYLVRTASLSTIPMTHIASLIITASGEELPLQKTPGAPTTLRITYDPSKPKKFNMKWVDAVGTAGCDPRKHKIIGKVDSLWKRGAAETEQTLNPELFGGPGAGAGAVSVQEEMPAVETAPPPVAKPEEKPIALPPQRENPGLA